MTAPARQFPGMGGAHPVHGSHTANRARQVPGHDGRTHTAFRSARPGYSVLHDVSNRPSVSVIHKPGGRVGSLALAIIGIALAVLGVSAIPFDPIAGFLCLGMGLIMAGAGFAAYNAARERGE